MLGGCAPHEHAVNKPAAALTERAPLEKAGAKSRTAAVAPKTRRPGEGFEFPFLGKVRAQSRRERVDFPVDGGMKSLSLKVFHAADGRFLRSEYVVPHAPDYQCPMAMLQPWYEMLQMKVTGTPTAPPEASWQSVLRGLGFKRSELDAITRLNITYVMLKRNDDPPEPVYIVCVFGIDTFIDSRFWGRPEHASIRYVIDSKGKVEFTDNML
jgi:hypothetical protein